MKKALIATAVSAAFAAPTTVLAQAAAAVPTLDKVLEASGVTVSGWIDTQYTHANRNLETGFSDRVFDSQNNSFALHQFGLQVAKQPKEGAGGLVNITAGKDAQVIHSFPETAAPGASATTTSMFDITQAYGQYASGPVTLMAGKFVTLHGTEVIASTGNNNISRSILFGAVPFTHTGVRAVYAMSDTVSLTAGVNNGWDQLQDQNKGKTVELGVSLNPIKPLTLAASGYFGKEITGASSEGKRSSANLVAAYTLSDTMTIGAEYLRVQQENFPALSDGTPTKAKYDGFAGYFTYMISPKLRAALRAETFKDKDGFHFGHEGAKYKEGTVTLAYLPSTSFEVRGEIRQDRASTEVFNEISGSGMSKTLLTYALQALYKF
ncbi:MAG TPA: outer membrane beta-barrel protein [Burkholderiales bacterium]|nr:outer membrane beta-barrel protein [Burkholderiales bacterium]